MSPEHLALTNLSSFNIPFFTQRKKLHMLHQRIGINLTAIWDNYMEIVKHW